MAVIGTASFACVLLSSVCAVVRDRAADRFLADAVALALVAGDRAAADSLAGSRGCTIASVVTRPLEVHVTLGGGCDGTSSLAGLG